MSLRERNIQERSDDKIQSLCKKKNIKSKRQE